MCRGSIDARHGRGDALSAYGGHARRQTVGESPMTTARSRSTVEHLRAAALEDGESPALTWLMAGSHDDDRRLCDALGFQPSPSPDGRGCHLTTTASYAQIWSWARRAAGTIASALQGERAAAHPALSGVPLIALAVEEGPLLVLGVAAGWLLGAAIGTYVTYYIPWCCGRAIGAVRVALRCRAAWCTMVRCEEPLKAQSPPRESPLYL